MPIPTLFPAVAPKLELVSETCSLTEQSEDCSKETREVEELQSAQPELITELVLSQESQRTLTSSNEEDNSEIQKQMNILLGEEPPTRRGHLPPQAVKILKSWLYEHRYNAYPTEVEKRILAQKGNIRVQQVNYWFVNARRRSLPEMIRRDGNNPAHFTISRRSKKSRTSNFMDPPMPLNMSAKPSRHPDCSEGVPDVGIEYPSIGN
ncbi:hypothetical protein KR222_001247 [Zaprionus bogoriensis]|nr:hypothetical protein KR222_001247 [Zaprionus bogoriensis]